MRRAGALDLQVVAAAAPAGVVRRTAGSCHDGSPAAALQPSRFARRSGIDELESIVAVTASYVAERREQVVVLDGDNDLLRYLYRPAPDWLRVEFYDWEDVEDAYDSFSGLATAVVRGMLDRDDGVPDEVWEDDDWESRME